MSLSEIKDNRFVVGSKQVKKNIAKGLVARVYIAADAEPRVIQPIQTLCSQNNIPVEIVEQMQMLGKACGIEVGAATVAIMKD